MIVITLSPEQSTVRLDRLIQEHFPGISRAKLQRAIKERGVIVNRKLITIPHTFLKPEDTIEIMDDFLASSSSPVSAIRHAITFPPILYEDEHTLAINKPSGLLIHPTSTSDEPTLVDALVQAYPMIAKVGDDTIVRPGIVHRLDREASGALLVAKTQTMFDHLKDQFKRHTIQKEYCVVVYGAIVKDHDDIRFPLSRSTHSGRMASHPTHDGEPTNALTAFDVIARSRGYTVLNVSTATGRTHQIRAHMLAYGHPVVGDRLYKTKRYHADAPRLMLHARKIGFTMLDGTLKTVEAPLPEEFQEYLSRES